MTVAMRHRFLVLGLLGTVVAAIFAPAPPTEEIVSAALPAPRLSHSATLAVRDSDNSEVVLEIRPRQANGDSRRAFASASWIVKKAEASVRQAEPAPPAPAPEAPPLPFRFLGRYVEDDRPAAFLQQNDRTIVAHAGDTIDEKYRVDNISDSGLTFTYLPLNQKQSLAATTSN